MTSYGYIIIIKVDSCMIWFHFDCIMQLKKSYHIATNVCSRKKCYYFWWSPWLLMVIATDAAYGHAGTGTGTVSTGIMWYLLMNPGSAFTTVMVVLEFVACWWETSGLLHPGNGWECWPPPSWYGVLSMHQATLSWCWWMARSSIDATLASCAKISFLELGQLSKEILCLCMTMSHPMLHEIHAIFWWGRRLRSSSGLLGALI